MNRKLIFAGIAIVLLGCVEKLSSRDPDPIVTMQTNNSYPTTYEVGWNVYDPDPEHLWNRVFRQFYRRVSQDGNEYGADELCSGPQKLDTTRRGRIEKQERGPGCQRNAGISVRSSKQEWCLN